MALLSLRHDGFMVASFSNNNGPMIHPIAPTATTNLRMISFGGSGDETSQEEQLPRDVKEAVTNCRQATQTALQNRLSRMDIEFPVGTDFGVEKKTKPKGGRRRNQQASQQESMDDGSGGGAPTQLTLDRSDRELARLFVDMFQPVGGDKIVVSFVDDGLAEIAKKSWQNDALASCRVLAMNRRPGGSKNPKKKKRKKVLTTSGMGFAAKMAAEVEDSGSGDNEISGSSGRGPFELPPNTEVALFVAPGPRELVVIEKICEKVGMGTLVVLLNARLDKISNFGTEGTEELFREDFESVFSLAAAPQEEAPNCLLYRAYPGDWVLARKPNVGRPKTILSQSKKPTQQECQQAFDELEITDLEKNVEGFVDNVAGWFR
jgi:hypothetical protein